MPNNTRLPACPYYLLDRYSSISCEDVYRDFEFTRQKEAWMDKYCCSKWQACPYADELTRMYERIEKGADMNQEQMQHKIKAQSKELRSKSTSLGMARKKIARMQKKIDELRTHNNKLIELNNNYYSKWRKAEAKIREADDKIHEELARMGIIYEQRMAYLIENFAPGKEMREKDVETWAKDKAFAVVHKGRGDELVWVVKYADEEESKVDPNGSEDNDLQRETQE